MISTKLFRVGLGITIAEGWHPKDVGNQGPVGSASYENHNPGNLRISEYEAGNTGGFSVFTNDIEGFMALVRQLELIATGKDTLYGDNDTIEQALATYTGLAVGSTELDDYLSTVESVGGVSRSDLVSTIA